ncbi:glucosamine-6-phosphate deaminase [Escherichia coli]|nr:glucosamine-6-phosphate deaminase [Escherichia coli]
MLYKVGINTQQHFGITDDAPRDKRTYFREINYIAAAFQYQKKNYKSA